MLEYCAAHLETILYIGGDLPQDIGDRVAAKVYLRCLWGATETGIVPQLLPPEIHPSQQLSRSLWRYVRFHPCVGAVFDKVTDGVYELVIRREQALHDTQPCFTIPGIQGLDEYRTKDLFEPHPSIPDLWCWRARSDDIIVFLVSLFTTLVGSKTCIYSTDVAHYRTVRRRTPFQWNNISRLAILKSAVL